MNLAQNDTKKQEMTHSRKRKQREINNMKQEVLNGKIPSMVADSGATSCCGIVNDPLIRTGHLSTKLFYTPLGQMVQESETEYLQQYMRELVQTADIIPRLLPPQYQQIFRGKLPHNLYTR